MRERPLRKDMLPYLLIMRSQKRFDVEVPGIKLLAYRTQLTGYFIFRQGQRTANDRGHAMDIRRDKRTNNDTRTFWQQRHLMSAKANRAHGFVSGGGVVRCSTQFISARARWNAKVDSAP